MASASPQQPDPPESAAVEADEQESDTQPAQVGFCTRNTGGGILQYYTLLH